MFVTYFVDPLTLVWYRTTLSSLWKGSFLAIAANLPVGSIYHPNGTDGECGSSFLKVKYQLWTLIAWCDVYIDGAHWLILFLSTWHANMFWTPVIVSITFANIGWSNPVMDWHIYLTDFWCLRLWLVSFWHKTIYSGIREIGGKYLPHIIPCRCRTTSSNIFLYPVGIVVCQLLGVSSSVTSALFANPTEL